MAPFCGVALLDKAEGETSFAALSSLKRRFNTRRVGHTGTLDPMATGLLVALVGPATRCARYFSSLDKVYVAEVTLGSETDTDDRTGQVTRSAPVPDMDMVLRASRKFVGEIEQVPPAYSAVHVDGRRAYDRARSGESVPVPPRRVTVHDLVFVRLTESTFRMTVSCTSGTYIRSLARDIGRAVDSAAHLSALRRTTVGSFGVHETSTGSRLDDDNPVVTLDLTNALLRLDGFAELAVSADTAAIMWNGGMVHPPSDAPTDTDRIVATFDGSVVCVGGWKAGTFNYDAVFPRLEVAGG